MFKKKKIKLYIYIASQNMRPQTTSQIVKIVKIMYFLRFSNSHANWTKI
jgi:hypothetical protein